MTNTDDTAAPADPMIRGFKAARLGLAREALAAAHAKVTKAAAKRGAEAPAAPVIVVRAERTTWTCWDRECNAGTIERGVCLGCGQAARRIDVVDLDVVGPRPVLAGWELLAVVEPLEALGGTGSQVRRVPGADATVDLTAYEVAGNGSACDHCDTKRRRSETFVVRHDDGRILRVGRQCLAAFLGVDPVSLVARLAWESIVRGADDEDQGGAGTGGDGTVGALELLAWVAAIVRVRGGYVSRKVASEHGGISTPSLAGSFLHPNPAAMRDPDFKAERLACTPTDADAEYAATAVAWARTLTGGDFERSLALVATCERLGYKQIGTACYIVPAYGKHVGDLAVKARRAEEVKVAAPVGKKVAIVGEVISAKVVTGDYGEAIKITVKVETPAGVWLAWGTAPASILRDLGDVADQTSAIRGRRVDLVAEVLSGREVGFGIMKRPRGALLPISVDAAA